MSLHIDRKLVYEFFERFARLECALKFTHYCTSDRYNNAKADWESFEQQAGPFLSACESPEIVRAIHYMLEKPPKIQVKVGEVAQFQRSDLRGGNNGAKSLDAAKRVRNNLFHGGKHSDHKDEEERNATLLRHAITIIEKAVEVELDLHYAYRKLA